MSTLLVLGYPTEDKAKQAYQEVLNLDNDLIVNLQSVAVVAKRDNGKFDVVTPGQPIGNSTVWGLFWGMLFGLIFLIPFWGAAIGAGLGAITGFFVKRGVDEDFQNRVRNLLTEKDEAARVHGGERDDRGQVRRRHAPLRRRRAADFSFHQGRGRTQVRAGQVLTTSFRVNR